MKTSPIICDANEYLAQLKQVLESLDSSQIDRLTDILFEAYLNGRQVLLFGNGGSAALASHAACDLGKGTVLPNHRRFRVLAVTDNLATITAWANDSNYADVFSEQLLNFVEPGDIAFAISGSGNSPNVLKGLQASRDAGATTVGIGGFAGGQMRDLCDFCLVVPSNNMQHIEDVHVIIMHTVFTALLHRIRTSN